MSEIHTKYSMPSMPSISRIIGMVFASIIISGVLYQIATPHLSYFLADIGRPNGQIPWWTVIVFRALEVLAYVATGFTDVSDIIMLVIISRTAYAATLCLSFQIPPGIPALTTIIDVAAIVLPITLLKTRKRVEPTEYLTITKESSLSVILTLIVSAFLSIGAYIATKTFLPAFVAAHFDTVRPVSSIPLPFLVTGFIPAGFCIQELIFKHGFHFGSLSILCSSFIVGCSNIGLAIRGGDLVGILGVVQFWNIIYTLACIVIGYIVRE